MKTMTRLNENRRVAGNDNEINGTSAVAREQIFLRSNRYSYRIKFGAGD